ncbi:tail fiber assembly protein [Kluyvera intermedia]|uniref:tail fiber assembly protein n=1 Tax=Kluyvera intermedia TaxID=61648 RepID=UPI00372D0102
MELKNVARYYPEYMPYGEAVQYFQSEDGKDFYESISLFTRKYKLCIEPDTGVIRSIAEDVSTLYPAGFTVVETNYLPDDCDIYGGWIYKNEVVSAKPIDDNAIAEEEKARLTEKANDAIRFLERAVRLGMATPGEESLLEAWEKYSVLLMRIKPDDAPDIDWPEVPEDVA